MKKMELRTNHEELVERNILLLAKFIAMTMEVALAVIDLQVKGHLVKLKECLLKKEVLELVEVEVAADKRWMII